MNPQPFERTVFWIVPASVLLAAFAGLCVMTGTMWPWHHVVHEDGGRTLLATVFFVEHATRELLPDALLALAVAGSVRHYFPPLRAAGSAETLRWRRRLGLVAAITVVGIAGGTVLIAGGQALIDNLSQLHTRARAPLVWGAHWRYHLIERFAQMMLAFSVTGVVWLLHGKPDGLQRAQATPSMSRGANRVRGRFGFYGAALLVFAALTVVFRPAADSFTDPAFLGHQLRELFTHSLVTLPLALGTCLALARMAGEESKVQAPESRVPIVLSGAAAIFSGAFLLVASMMTDAQSHGQADGLAALLFPHFFEHALGYILVPAFAGWIYLARVRLSVPG